MKKRVLVGISLLFVIISCYKIPPIETIKTNSPVKTRTLLIALDGVDYDLVKELKDEGHFQNFLEPVPLLSTFPSDTTVGFTGILRPLGVDKIQGYESQFYSYEDNKIKGGTLFDIHTIPLEYKRYFDSFRHQIHEKAIMYIWPGAAGKRDLINSEKILYDSPKNIVMTYVGGTDGFSHILGRNRTKRFLIFMDQFLIRMQTRYEKKRQEKLKIVLYSDHGFHHENLKSVSFGEFKRRLQKKGFRFRKSLEKDKDIVAVSYGLLSAGVMFTKEKHRAEIAETLRKTKGIDLVFWHEGNKKEIFVLNHEGKLAKFEYRSKKLYRYVTLTGNPLRYSEKYWDPWGGGRRRVRHGAEDEARTLDRSSNSSTESEHHGKPETDRTPKGSIFQKVQKSPWLSDKTWFQLTYDHEYPDVGYRLYDSFFDLVQNPASLMFSTKKNYHYGSFSAKLGVTAKFGHKGTHGGIFRSTTWGVFMTTSSFKKLPKALRYDEMFPQILDCKR